ncbi:hypothetical protein B0H19DRAFT_1110990, partial [Mycena capillaripes]
MRYLKFGGTELTIEDRKTGHQRGTGEDHLSSPGQRVRPLSPLGAEPIRQPLHSYIQGQNCDVSRETPPGPCRPFARPFGW